jgi:four helix bundle protein
MATIKTFEELEVWKLAEQQDKDIYPLTLSGSFSKDWELINQIRRSTGSVMDNIAEGFGRGGKKEFVHFLTISRGSNDEVRSQLHRAKNRGHIDQELHQVLVDKNNTLGVKLSNFITYLNQSEHKGQKFNRV